MKRTNTSSTQTPRKRVRYEYSEHEYRRLALAVENAKRKSRRRPDTRVYQIGRLPEPDDRGIRFCVGRVEEVLSVYIQNGDECNGLHTNLMEYIFSGERCPLMFDVEWVTPNNTPTDDMENINSALTSALVAFINMSLKHDSQHIERADVCVQRSCKRGKASFHIIVHKLVFACLERDMRYFVFYFCSWLYETEFDKDKTFGIPDIFFLQTKNTKFEPGTVADIAAYDGNEQYDSFIQRLREKAERQWATRGWHRYASCGIDTAIYSAGRAFRCAGSTKPNKPGELPRLLLPCLITDWWATRVSAESLADNTPVPDKQYRREWARAAMMMMPEPNIACVSIRVPRPTGFVVHEDQADNDGDDDDDDEVWHWSLDTTPYPWPVRQHGHARRALRAGVQRVVDHGNDTPSIVLFADDRELLFEKRGGRWYNVTDSVWCDDETSGNVEELKRDALYYVVDSRTKHWHMELDRRLLALQHMETSGVIHDDSGRSIDYGAMRTGYEEAKQNNDGTICIRSLDDRAERLLFMDSDIVLDPCFPIMDAGGRLMRLGDIFDKTPVFCPKHPDDNPSAFVGIDSNGRRFLSCSACGGAGLSVREAPPEDGGDDDWYEIRSLQLGSDVVQIITERRYLKIEDVIQVDPAEMEDIEPLDPTVGPMVYVCIADMGIGKTTVLKKLFSDPNGVTLIMRLLEKENVIDEQPSVLNVSPRIALAESVALMLGLCNYKQLRPVSREQGAYEASLCEQDRLSICINSLLKLAARADGVGYDVIILDEFATSALSLIGKLMLPRAKRTMEILTKLMQKARMVFMLAADGDMKTIRTLMPFIEWNAPPNQIPNLSITVHKGGVGGIQGHQMYMSSELEEVVRVLKMYVLAGKRVYIPTNKKRFAEQLYAFCREHLELEDDEIVVLSRVSTKRLMDTMISNPEKHLGFKKNDNGEFVIDPSRRQVKVFIATPKFGVGFSLSSGLFDVTVAFFFIYPQTVPGNVQHLARVRGNKEKTIICYYESRRYTGPGNSESVMRDRIMRQVATYSELLQGAEQHCEDLSEVNLREYAIGKYILEGAAKWDAAGMFAAAVEKATRLTPMDLLSFVCCKGGPVQNIPFLTDDEARTIVPVAEALDEENLPITQQQMNDLWSRQNKLHGMSRQELRDLPQIEEDRLQPTPAEIDLLQLYKELPIPAGLLCPFERKVSFVKCLDNLWRVLEMAAGPDRLKMLDVEKGDNSADVSFVSPTEREHQQYEVFATWAQLVILGNSMNAGSDNGVLLLKYMCDNSADGNAAFCINLKPNLVDRDDISVVFEQFKRLTAAGADVKTWFVHKDLHALNRQVKILLYAKIIRKGFRQLLGKNVKVNTVRKKGIVRVVVKGFKRLISLACVRRIRLSCYEAIRLTHRNYTVISAYREVAALVGFVPSIDELDQLCGIEDVDNIDD